MLSTDIDKTDLYRNVREYIKTAIDLLEVSNRVTSELERKNERIKIDLVEYFISAHSTYISSDESFEIRMGSTRWDKIHDEFSVQTYNGYPLITMIFGSTSDESIGITSEYYANSILEEELFQNNTILDDLQLCFYYIKRYICEYSGYKNNIIMVSYFFKDIDNDTKKMKTAIKHFEFVLHELTK